MTNANSKSECASLRGRSFELDGERFQIEDASMDHGQIMVWFQNDGTRWVYASEIELV